MKKLNVWLILFYLLVVLVMGIVIINLTIIIKGKVNPNKIPDFFGYKPFVVLSGSMETSINVGDLVVVKEKDAKKIKTGDVIAFRKDDIVITHRVIEVLDRDGTFYFTTKGDNNNTADNDLVSDKDIEGVYAFKVSGLGNVFMFLSKPLGMLVIILFIVVIAGGVYFMTFKPSKEELELMKEFEEFKKQKKLDDSKK